MMNPSAEQVECGLQLAIAPQDRAGPQVGCQLHAPQIRESA